MDPDPGGKNTWIRIRIRNTGYLVHCSIPLVLTAFHLVGGGGAGRPGRGGEGEEAEPAHQSAQNPGLVTSPSPAQNPGLVTSTHTQEFNQRTSIAIFLFLDTALVGVINRYGIFKALTFWDKVKVLLGFEIEN
jgi:hypothetical protein